MSEREFARAFGKVEHNRCRGTGKLIRKMTPSARKVLDQFISEREEVEGKVYTSSFS
ncbi:MAG TPA: hypothetical protein VNM92_01485 [Thermoanaerobaculia bacterium]|nr:hypothetical protein [Thermoanaerobaculia bacterium]